MEKKIPLATEQSDVQNIFEASRIYGGLYREPEQQEGKFNWPRSTWMRKRLAKLNDPEREL